MSNLTPVVKSIQDVMRQDAGINGDAQRIEQMVWLLFLKVFDALEEELELTRDGYKSPIPEHLRWRNWATDPEGITGDALLDFVNNTLFPKLKALPADPVRNPRGWVVRGVFEDANNFMKSGQLLRQVINKLGAIDFNRQAERHQFNDLYEKILRDLQSAGNAGEFYTPRAVTQFMVDMVNPQLGEKVLDPATGTGGFLVCAIEHLRKQVKNTEQEALLQNSILGVEKKQLPHMLCVTNLLLHGIEVPSNVRHDNTLARPLRDYAPAERVDVVLTNPPFGGIEEPGIEAGFPADVRTKETADLFLVLIKHILKANGRAAVVLPDGTLFGEGVKTRIKEQLLAECNLHTIVRLPNGVFAPYTGIKTNLLFFTKGQPTEAIWYYEHPYPAGVKSYNKTKPLRIEEFDAEKAWWGSEADGFVTRMESDRAWKVDIAAIKAAGYNLDQKNPHTPNATSHDAEELLRSFALLRAEAQGLRDQLKTIVSESLHWQRVADHVDLLLDHPDAVDALEQSILQVAVRGMLVPQDPNDESASELVLRIRNYREVQIKAGIAKREKPFTSLSAADLPFELPTGWEWIRFGELIEPAKPISYGVLVPGPEISGGVPFVRIADLSLTDPPAKPEKSIGREIDAQYQRTRLEGGEILMGVVGSIGKLGVAPPSWAGANIARAICRIVPVNLVNRDFVLLLLQSDFMQASFAGDTRTLAQPTLNVGLIRSSATPLPPIAEQVRIVARVTELHGICAALRQRLESSIATRAALVDSLINQALTA